MTDGPLDELDVVKANEPHRGNVVVAAIPWLALVLVLLVGGPGVTYLVTKAHGERDSARAERDVIRTQAKQLEEQVKSLGAKPVVTPAASTSSPEPTAKNLSTEEVRAVVVTELGKYKLTITQAEVNQIARTAAALVPKPKDGKTPTTAELQTYAKIAVGAYCLEDRCVGKPGTPGPRGERGPAGENAPKVTDEELLRAAQQALLSYCGQETQPCKGEQGATGSTGPVGADGRGITDTDCLEDGTWRISYTDGTSQIVRGPCRVVVVPPAEKATN